MSSATGAPFGGRYRLHERIGSGGMGAVYRAEQVALGRTVAIKMLHPELAAIPEVVRRFHVEARAASRLFHPGSVGVYDYGLTADGTPFLVMEYVVGQVMSDYIRAKWPVPLSTVVDLGLQILAAVSDAHANGIIHADIKSDNVIIETRRDGSLRAKIVDYGLARLVDECNEGSCGTPEYMAPEVACGGPVTEAADLYSVGATLYELLTGAPPFLARTPEEVLDQQVSAPVTPPSARQSSREIPAALEAVVMRALAKTPAGRFADAMELATALERARPVDAAAAVRCHCGAPVPPRTLVCKACGELRRGLIAPTREQADTASQGPGELERRLARGSGADPSPEDQVVELRTRIGAAIQRGALDEIAHGYLELSGAISVLTGVRAAAKELEEGIDVITSGGGPRARGAPERLWELLIELARLYQADGDRIRARSLAAAAHFQAVSCRSSIGLGTSVALLAELHLVGRKRGSRIRT